MDWENLGFEFRQTRSYLRYVWRDGEWDEGELVAGEPTMNVHVACTALHYGQSVFEGLKAFAWEDGSVRVFRPDENAKRMARSADRTMMPSLPVDDFVAATQRLVRDNLDYVPPPSSKGALYIRPLLFGSGPRIGLSPSDEYTLIFLAMPVGDYYAGGKLTPVKGGVVEGYDRAAPNGVGDVKVAGNYAADLKPNQQMKKDGFPIGLYLDARTNTLVEEFSTSNFFGITEDGTYVTPESPAVLPSITNKCLMDLAKDEGREVQRRPIPVTELDSFKEVAACGTAVVITPIRSIQHGEKEYFFGDKTGPVTQHLYQRLRAMQTGEEADTLGWSVVC